MLAQACGEGVEAAAEPVPQGIARALGRSLKLGKRERDPVEVGTVEPVPGLQGLQMTVVDIRSNTCSTPYMNEVQDVDALLRLSGC